jgi:hypothetical protein
MRRNSGGGTISNTFVSYGALLQLYGSANNTVGEQRRRPDFVRTRDPHQHEHTARRVRGCRGRLRDEQLSHQQHRPWGGFWRHRAVIESGIDFQFASGCG